MMPIRSRGGVWPGSSRQAVTETPPSRVVSKPVPERETKDARGYQIEQLKRRYSPQENDIGHGMVSLLFHLTPSDPDFPFDLNHLECDLRIPEGYPKHPPQLLIKNKDIPRGFVINIERGWDALVQQKRGATLLTLVKALDRRLESLLSEKKAETVKLTIFKDTRHLDSGPASVSGSQPVKPITKPTVDRPYIPEESYSKDQIAEAKARRAQDVRQLEARMHRSPDYQKSSDGVVYTLSLEPKRRASLPPSLQPVQSVQLIVPLLYPLQPLRILLNDVGSEDAEPVEELFAQKAAEQKQMSLTSHLNYLAQNMDRLAKQAQKAPAEVAPAVEVPASAVQEAEEAGEAEEAAQTPFKETGKGHVHVIPRPVEWADYGTGSSESDDDSDDDDEDGGAVIEAEPAGPSLPTQTAELGTAMSFPSIELYGIELLQVSVLNLSVKCDRCKTINETTGLKDNFEKASSCKKCATPFAVRFRQELVHQHSTRAGFIDVTGCTVADLLPSTFTPTCATCSTTSPTGLTSVRGETTTNVCRTCHARFTFALPDVRFLAYAPGSQSLPPTTGPRRRQERLGLHAGEPLPARGACVHYRRSYRWFRFSCCAKVFPCDRCHDASEEHVNEWATRMVCGWCSREQRFQMESCAFCGRSVIGKRGNGYWEGGKGTRDQRLMRRGDKRKYRRLGTAKKED